jgi:hypothetical protein
MKINILKKKKNSIYAVIRVETIPLKKIQHTTPAKFLYYYYYYYLNIILLLFYST